MTRKLKGAVAVTTIALVAAWVKRKWMRRPIETSEGESFNEYDYRQEPGNDDDLADIIQRARPALERAYSLETS
jgi:hypothetical protein